MMTRLSSFAAATLTFLAATNAVQAQTWRSGYTDIDFERCTVVSSYELGAELACPGYNGFPLMIADGDLRMFVSYGFGAPDEMAAGQTFPQFNQIGDKIEWLLEASSEWGERPVATIVRYYLEPIEPGDPQGQVLVVTKIEEGNTCWVAQIDARANANANQMARDAARRLVRGWDCQTMERETVGVWNAFEH
ncbi:hypothetical protein [Pelagibacterium sp.]|uniref:hypothetical protein n=1 Tax=Pelagibacterium sp. TaxID=1967288 RepID=UPI003A8E730C